MSGRLVIAGCEVTGADPDPAARAVAEALGMPTVSDAADAPAADALLLCLPGPAEVLELLDRGLPEPPRLLVNLSTVGPQATAAIAERVRATLPTTAFVESPISGGVLRAARGECALLCGADPPEALDEAAPLLSLLGREVIRFPSVEAASTAKLVNNLAILATALGTLEALEWGARRGLPLDAMFDALAAGTADSYALRSTLTRSVRHGDFDVGFAMRLALKDVGLALDGPPVGDDPPMPFAREVRRQLAEGCDAGLADRTFPAVALLRDLRGPSTPPHGGERETT